LQEQLKKILGKIEKWVKKIYYIRLFQEELMVF
jgi:hypothetical protein